MAFRRLVAPRAFPDAGALTSDMVGVGMLFAAEPNDAPNIEDTLYFASRAGLLGDDFRVLSVLCTWLGVHVRHVNADRLTMLVRADSSVRVRAFWCAVAKWNQADRRFMRLAKVYRGPRHDALSTGQSFQLQRHGEDPRFEGTPFRVDAKLLRERSGDVMTEAELAARHPMYRWRLAIGPSFRADLWAHLERDSSLGPSELARRAYSSIGAAWSAKRDFQVWREAGAKSG